MTLLSGMVFDFLMFRLLIELGIFLVIVIQGTESYPLVLWEMAEVWTLDRLR